MVPTQVALRGPFTRTLVAVPARPTTTPARGRLTDGFKNPTQASGYVRTVKSLACLRFACDLPAPAARVTVQGYEGAFEPPPNLCELPPSFSSPSSRQDGPQRQNVSAEVRAHRGGEALSSGRKLVRRDGLPATDGPLAGRRPPVLAGRVRAGGMRSRMPKAGAMDLDRARATAVTTFGPCNSRARACASVGAERSAVVSHSRPTSSIAAGATMHRRDVGGQRIPYGSRTRRSIPLTSHS